MGITVRRIEAENGQNIAVARSTDCELVIGDAGRALECDIDAVWLEMAAPETFRLVVDLARGR